MSNKNVVIEANANFHHAEGENLFNKTNERFMEYREKWKEWPRDFHVGEFPLFIDIEVTSVCNLKCPFCATTYRGDLIDRGYITFDMVKKVVDEGADRNLYGIKFNIRGEPLLHKEIHKFVDYAKKKGLIDVYFNTNALLLKDDMARKLIDAGLDRISISTEGFTKEVYEKHRVGGKFEKFLRNIENLNNLKEKLGVKHPKIRIQTVMLEEIKPLFADYKAFWGNYADEVAYLDFKEMNSKHKNVQFAWACPQIWQRMALWWDGTILPCNHDDDGSLNLGNIKNMSIQEAWQSEQLNEIRDRHKSGLSHEITACDGCYLRDSEIAKIGS